MLKKLLAIFTLFTALTATADEGMWTLYNLPDAVYRQMQAEGFQLPKSSIYADGNALKNSVVIFNGNCTGVVASQNGLVFTNHHCGFDAVRQLSSVENDRLTNGFIADSIGAELPCEDLYVAFMRSQEDVTATLDSLGLRSLSKLDQEFLIDSLADAMTSEARKKDSALYVIILPFYEGNAYYATTYCNYNDVRLVAAPPKSIGKFGGETDNWMWPRQTCDFTLFRIYAKENGTPAPYSKTNVPLATPAFIPVSTDGYKLGDFAMTIGYPGSTSRYISSYGIEERRNCLNEPTYQMRDVKLKVMKKHMDRSDEVRLKYDAAFYATANYYKNYIGMNKCIDSIGLIQQKRDYEQLIAERQHLDVTPLARLYANRAEAKRAMTLIKETFGTRSNSELAERVTKFGNGTPAKKKSRTYDGQYIEFDNDSSKYDRALDIDLLAATMKEYRRLAPAQYLPSFYETVDKEYEGDYTRYVTEIWDKSVFMQPEARIPQKLTKRLSRDIGIQFATSVMETYADVKLALQEGADSIHELEQQLCTAKIRMEENMPLYSDANFTMRLSYGQIEDYVMGNGQPSGYYTTAASMVEKMKQGNAIEDYRTTDALQGLFTQPTYNMYTDSVSQTLNLCFLSNNDITGGNSGSPVIDGKGRLIGLAFDGNWESLASSIRYDRRLARTISVDIRYVLYMLQQWGNANAIIQELLGPSMPK